MARVHWPGHFAALMQVAYNHETAHELRAAWETYLLAASVAPNALSEEFALEYGWQAYEREIDHATQQPTLPFNHSPSPQGDGDPRPTEDQ